MSVRGLLACALRHVAAISEIKCEGAGVAISIVNSDYERACDLDHIVDLQDAIRLVKVGNCRVSLRA